MSTAEIAQPISGDKLYQKRAREAFPFLVRQAEAGKPIYYSDLAALLGMSNPRNLNYVLGSIGQSLMNLSKAWNEGIPQIQCLVIGKNDNLPGAGIGWFLNQNDFAVLSLQQKKMIFDSHLQKVYLYPKWKEVLKTFSLSPMNLDYSGVIKSSSRTFGGGEGEQHKKLKEFVASNPTIIGLENTTRNGVTEYPLPSGDSLDVSFRDAENWIAVEVKSSISSEDDIFRGLFQCVKYLAVMDAVLITENKPRNARTILVLGGEFPNRLMPLKNLLGIEVVFGVETKNHI